MKLITIIIATTGKNLDLAKSFKQKLEDSETKVNILNVVDMDLPLYASIHESKFVAMDLVGKELEEMKKSSAFIVVTPEYNGGLPPAIPNFFAWISRSTKDWRECFNSKPCAIATFSAGSGIHVLALLRLQLSFMGLNVIGRQVVTNMAKPQDEDGVVAVSHMLRKLI